MWEETKENSKENEKKSFLLKKRQRKKMESEK